MSIKNNKLGKIFSACLLVTGSMFAVSNASAATGWPVVNVMDSYYYNAYFGTTGIFTRAMGQQNQAIKGAVDTNRAVNELRIKQAEQHQNDSDMRLRMAIGQADIARRDFEQMPTLAYCAELSKGGAMAKVIGASEVGSGYMGGSSGGSGAVFNTGPNRATSSNSAVTASLELKQKAVVGTCTPDMAGIAGCPGTLGDTPTPDVNGGDMTAKWKEAMSNPSNGNEFLGADLYPSGILGNVSNKEKIKTLNSIPEYANYSVSQKVYDTVMSKYIGDAALGNRPKTIVTKEAKTKNPLFFNKYYNVMIKLHAAENSLRSIGALRIGADPSNFKEGSLAAEIWKTMSEKYQEMYPHLKKPEAPSLYELMRFSVHKDMFAEDVPPGDPTTYQQAMLRRVALNNMLMLKNFENQERANILLANILVQLTTPVNAEEVSKEAVASSIK
jgi:hypothetical protein